MQYISVGSGPENYPYCYEINIGKNIPVSFAICSPTGNCQIFSINGFENILRYCRELSLNEKDTVEGILKEITPIFHKTTLLIDVYDKIYHDNIVNIFTEENIIAKTPYVNKTKKEMCIYLLNVKL